MYHFYPFIKARNEKINELQAITFRDLSATSAETVLAPPKRAKRQKKIQNFFKKVFGVKKLKVANRLKRVFPKFRADPSHPRGVNGRLKFSRFFASAFARASASGHGKEKYFGR